MCSYNHLLVTLIRNACLSPSLHRTPSLLCFAFSCSSSYMKMLSALFGPKIIALGPIIGARWKHSNTQVKRLFKNPARKRVEARMGIDHSPAPLEPTKYAPVFQPNFLPNGWSAPAPSDLVPEYPFAVTRTKNKPKDAIGFLPVYSKFR
jgi:hypothetical protein